MGFDIIGLIILINLPFRVLHESKRLNRRIKWDWLLTPSASIYPVVTDHCPKPLDKESQFTTATMMMTTTTTMMRVIARRRDHIRGKGIPFTRVSASHFRNSLKRSSLFWTFGPERDAFDGGDNETTMTIFKPSTLTRFALRMCTHISIYLYIYIYLCISISMEFTTFLPLSLSLSFSPYIFIKFATTFVDRVVLFLDLSSALSIPNHSLSPSLSLFPSLSFLSLSLYLSLQLG